ncbi:MAG: ankyrin repeat domain-containing protein, partial [Alphaproteobacteria bacterium]
MKNKEIIAVLEFENPNYKRLFLILSFIMISFIYSPKIMAQIEGLYNQNDEQFAGISNLMSAVSNNDVEGTRFFAKAGSIIVNQKNKGGATALHIASREGNLDIVKILIDSGANPNIADNEGYTPLMRASLSASAEVVEYLLKNGAKPGIFNSQNETAIIHATNSKCDDCINALIENGQIIKSVDTLLLKAQIADAIVVANNQDNEKTKAILHGFLDYVSKSAPLVVKSKADEADEPLPFKSNFNKNSIKTPIIQSTTLPVESKLTPSNKARSLEQNSVSNIFEEPIDILPSDNPKKEIVNNSDKNSLSAISKNEIYENSDISKDLPINTSNQKDEIVIPIKKYTFKKELEQTKMPVVVEKMTKISEPEVKSTPIKTLPVKKFKFTSIINESKPEVVNPKPEILVKENIKEENKAPVKKFKFKSQNPEVSTSDLRLIPAQNSIVEQNDNRPNALSNSS